VRSAELKRTVPFEWWKRTGERVSSVFTATLVRPPAHAARLGVRRAVTRIRGDHRLSRARRWPLLLRRSRGLESKSGEGLRCLPFVSGSVKLSPMPVESSRVGEIRSALAAPLFAATPPVHFASSLFKYTRGLQNLMDVLHAQGCDREYAT
jgi:hypothetical protein